MANKIKCTCGHSWSTADSSAKDKYVCHICGKNNMKDGGWLNKYEAPQAENGIEGTMGGLTDKGFNYNGAWGGPSMQVGGSILKFLEPTSKKLPEGYNPSPKARGSSTEYAVSIGGEDGEPAYLIPSFKYGELLLDPKAEFRRTGEHLGGPFKTYQEADEWERTVRHPYVEKGQTIPTPIKRWGDMAMGGSLPGSVGFTYARTGGIPSNGPYAKKTKASAQDGKEITPTQFYNEYLNSPNYINRLKLQGYKDPKKTINDRLNNLNKTKVTNVKGIGNVYHPDQNTINLDFEEQKKYNLDPLSTKVHEYSHAAGSLGHYATTPEKIKNTTLNRKEINLIDRGNKFWNLDLDDRKKYSIDKAMEIEHDRVASEAKADMDVLRYNLKKDKIYDTGTQNFNQEYLNKSKNKYKNNKVINRLFDRYSDKDLINLMNTIAKTDDNDNLSFAQNGMEMKFYQEGLDWKPRNISRDGSEIPQAQVGTMVTPLDFSKPLGTLEGVSEVMSAPARTATYLLTGKYQDPSQALGIKNPVGAFVTDAILDPVNLLGVGVATKAVKATKAAVKASKESGLLSKAYKLNPRAFKPNPEAVYRQIGEPGYQNAIQEGKVLAKGQKEFLEKNPGFNYWDEYNKFMDFSKKTGLNLEKPKVAPFFQKGELFFPISNKTGFGRGKTVASDVKYLLEGKLPEEAIVPRYRDQYLTNEVFNRNTTGGTGVLDPKYSDLSNFDMYQKHWLQGYKKIPKKKKEKGGIVKDDNGYWNPDNWGKPVEIGSNNITMQGVNEPLIGVSDTGDTQMMYPGEDYKFKGKKVTEYPVSKKWLEKYK